MTTFSLLNFGCRASQADGAALKRRLLESGLAESQDEIRSDVTILNTCTVTAVADAEIRQTIRRIHRENSRSKILVTGCYAQRAPQEIAALEGVAWVVGNSHKHEIPEILRGAVDEPHATPKRADPGEKNQACLRVSEVGPEFHFLPVFPDDRTRPTLKVQDGCNARCSFCIIPTVRGRSRSLPPDRVIEQVCSLEKDGINEIVLSGINLGGYGRDLDRGITFRGLIERILCETGIARLRISSIEPMDVCPALIRLVATEPRLADHFHIPLQSGCDRILRQMNRRYWADQYAERLLAIRESMPDCGIGADVMTGFPGETTADHEESARFIDSMPFTYLHIFPYSSRPSTPAAARLDQINGRISHERSQPLRAMIARKRQAFLATQCGRAIRALTLSDRRPGEALALTSNYLAASLPGCEVGPNRLVKVRVSLDQNGRLYGYVEDDAEAGGTGNVADRRGLDAAPTSADGYNRAASRL